DRGELATVQLTPAKRRRTKDGAGEGQLDLGIWNQPVSKSQTESATAALRPFDLPARSQAAIGEPLISSLWVDGFIEMTDQELGLLGALIPHCREATITFCLDRAPTEKISWLSNWSAVCRSYEKCKQSLLALPGARISVEVLARESSKSRFSTRPALAHLER